MPVTAMTVVVLLIAIVMPASMMTAMTVTAPAVVAISATINAALAVAIPDHEVVAFAFLIVTAVPVALAATPASADWAAADGVIVGAGAADGAADGAASARRARIYERGPLATVARRSGIAGRAARRDGVAVGGRNAGAAARGHVDRVSARGGGDADDALAHLNGGAGVGDRRCEFRSLYDRDDVRRIHLELRARPLADMGQHPRL